MFLYYKIWKISVFLKSQVIGFDLPVNVTLKVVEADGDVKGDGKGSMYFSNTYMLFHFLLLIC